MTKLILFTLILCFSHISFAKECVVLLHGLARTSNSMIPLKTDLKLKGYKMVNINYPSTEFTIEELAEKYVLKGIESCGDYSNIHFVTHSMGGILVRYYFEHFGAPENLGHVVMLAPPNKGSEVVDSLKDMVGFSWWNGPAGSQLGTDELSVPNQLGPVDYSVGVIAGTKESLILSQYIQGPNDGKVSVESSKVEGMADHISLYVSHTFIMNSRAVYRQVYYFLRYGEFDH